ncbi:10024_t:CDS:2, partial [Racocetra fulgida]
MNGTVSIEIAEDLGLDSTGIRNDLIDRIRKHWETKNEEISTDIDPIGTSSSRPDSKFSSSSKPTTEIQSISSPNEESETSDSDSKQDTSSSDESNIESGTSRGLPIARIPEIAIVPIPSILKDSRDVYDIRVPDFFFVVEWHRFWLAQYGIFFTTAGHFDWAEDVRDFIPDNLIYTGAGSAVIFSLYE